MIRRVVAAMIALCGVVALPAWPGTGPRFVLVDGELPEVLERRLQSAGSRGYRLIAIAEGTDVSGRSRVVTLLERSASGTTFEYAVRSGTGDLSDTSMSSVIDRLFEQGYRLSPVGFVVRRRPEVWLPETAYADQATIILERGAGSRNGWAYRSMAFGTEKTFYRALDEHRREGFEILGLWNTDRKLQVVLQRSADRDAASNYTASEDHRLVLIATRRVLKIKLNSLARKGYRIREAEDPPTAGPPMLLLGRTSEIGKPIEYRFFKSLPKRMRKDRFADKLNALAVKGWRMTPGGLTDRVATLERDPKWKKGEPRASYRLVSSANAEELASRIEGAYSEGYSFVTMVVEPAQTSALLERIDSR